MKKFIIGLILLISSTVYAEDITVQGGFLYTDNSNYGNGYSTNVRVEKRILSDLALGLEGGWHGPQQHYPDTYNVSPYGDMFGSHLIGEVIYYPPLNWKAKPYGFAGFGWSWWDFERAEELTSRGIGVAMHDAPAQKYGFGFDLALLKGWFLNVEYNYFHAFVPLDTYYESDGSFANVIGNDDRSGRRKIGQEEHNVVIGIKYRF